MTQLTERDFQKFIIPKEERVKKRKKDIIKEKPKYVTYEQRRRLEKKRLEQEKLNRRLELLEEVRKYYFGLGDDDD